VGLGEWHEFRIAIPHRYGALSVWRIAPSDAISISNVTPQRGWGAVSETVGEPRTSDEWLRTRGSNALTLRSFTLNRSELTWGASSAASSPK
jgi:hypothetical protein